jgi:hypothetical protein
MYNNGNKIKAIHQEHREAIRNLNYQIPSKTLDYCQKKLELPFENKNLKESSLQINSKNEYLFLLHFFFRNFVYAKFAC